MIDRAYLEAERAKHRSTRRRGCMCDAQSCHFPEFCKQVVCDCGRDLPCIQSEILALALSAEAPLVIPGEFVAHSGETLSWKIECDSLSDSSISGIAFALSQSLPPFGSVEGVPRGGRRLAEAMRKYVTTGPLLIVDDVCTTGNSLDEFRDGRDAIGAVIFNRGTLPSWCQTLFDIPQRAEGYRKALEQVLIDIDANHDKRSSDELISGYTAHMVRAALEETR